MWFEIWNFQRNLADSQFHWNMEHWNMNRWHSKEPNIQHKIKFEHPNVKFVTNCVFERMRSKIWKRVEIISIWMYSNSFECTISVVQSYIMYRLQVRIMNRIFFVSVNRFQQACKGGGKRTRHWFDVWVNFSWIHNAMQIDKKRKHFYYRYISIYRNYPSCEKRKGGKQDWIHQIGKK